MTDVRSEPDGRRRDDDGVRLRTRVEHRGFRCQGCGTTWIATYEVRDYEGPSGVHWVVHCQDGRPVPGPHLGDRCPGCGLVSTSGMQALDGAQVEGRGAVP